MATRSSIGIERLGNHLTRDMFGYVWWTDTKGAEHLETPVVKIFYPTLSESPVENALAVIDAFTVK
ncbi:unnamed protein product [marine sediment metagenome]|uniref:Uncharacterized protein n=1 Tax=marine sediment metagenome TaxID=412755 RepID=X1J9M4_9ZZZZ